MQHLAQDALEFGSEHYTKWMETYQGVRVSTARPDQRDPRRNRHREEHFRRNRHRRDRVSPGSPATSSSLSRRVPCQLLSVEAPRSGRHRSPLAFHLRRSRSDRPACKGARMLAISFVQYLSGYRVNLESIGEICARHGCLFLRRCDPGSRRFPDRRSCRQNRRARGGWP